MANCMLVCSDRVDISNHETFWKVTSILGLARTFIENHVTVAGPGFITGPLMAHNQPQRWPRP